MHATALDRARRLVRRLRRCSPSWARSIGPDLSDNLTLPGSDSQKATDLLEERFPSRRTGPNPSCCRAPTGAKITDVQVQAARSTTRSRRCARTPTSALRRARCRREGAAQLSKDGTVGYIALNLKTEPERADHRRRAAHRRRSADPARGRGPARSAFGGYLGQKVSKPETHVSEVDRPRHGRDRPAVHVRHRRRDGAADHHRDHRAGLPGCRSSRCISHVAEVPTVAPTLATMIGLGRRDRLRAVHRHPAPRAAARRDGHDASRSPASTATSGGAVVFAGHDGDHRAAVAAPSCGIPLVTTLGYTAALVVLVAVTAAITLLPALLGVVGDRIDRLAAAAHGASSDDGHPHGWERWGEFVARHPLPARGVGARRAGRARACPCSTSTSASRTTARCPTSTRGAAGLRRLTRASAPGANGPLLVASTCRRSRRSPTSQLDELDAGERPEGRREEGDEQAQQIAASSRRRASAGRRSPGQAQVQPSSTSSIKQITQQADDQRKKLDQRHRPAPAAAAHGPAETAGVRRSPSRSSTRRARPRS